MRVPFAFPTKAPTWHPGHMATTLTKLSSRLGSSDLVIEVRDARLPLTSINPAFDRIILSNHTPRLVVYNKSDLAEQRFEPALAKALSRRGINALFASSKDHASVRQVLDRGIALSCGGDAARKKQAQSKGISWLVVGMPNVGKSTLLNVMRQVGCHRGKAASTAPEPGHTRAISGPVRIVDPSSKTSDVPIYLADSPGVMVPFLGTGEDGAERGLKLGLTAGLKESLHDPEDLVDYLVHRLFLRLSPSFPPSALLAALSLPPSLSLPPYPFLPASPPPDAPEPDRRTLAPLPTDAVVLALAQRLQARAPGGDWDLSFARRWLLRAFREGRFGGWTLDELDPQAGEGGEADGMDERVASTVESYLDSRYGRGEAVSKTREKSRARERATAARAAARKRVARAR